MLQVWNLPVEPAMQPLLLILPQSWFWTIHLEMKGIIYLLNCQPLLSVPYSLSLKLYISLYPQSNFSIAPICLEKRFREHLFNLCLEYISCSRCLLSKWVQFHLTMKSWCFAWVCVEGCKIILSCQIHGWRVYDMSSEIKESKSLMKCLVFYLRGILIDLVTFC